MTRMSLWRFLLRLLFLVVFAGGIIASIILIGGSSLSPRESALMGMVLTILSVLASWIITNAYSESVHKTAIEEVQEQHRTNLRTYALKAAEKVNNLSNELQKLSAYLDQELNATDYSSIESELQAKEERMAGAIHIIQTLKSVNDTSLSDWEGVIGEELDEQREERERREEELRSVIERAEFMLESQRQEFIGSQHDAESVRMEVKELKDQLRYALAQLGETAIPKTVAAKKGKESIGLGCPSCGSMIEYTQRALPNSIKQVRCKNCRKSLISTYSEGKGFILALRTISTVTVQCPKCSAQCEVETDNYPGRAVAALCTSCNTKIRVVNAPEGLEVQVVEPPHIREVAPKLSAELLDLIRGKLPDQPWSTGIHRQVAEQLGVPTTLVYRAIQELVRRGIFNRQIDGVVYVPVKPADQEKEAPTSSSQEPES
jgi:hypothetical protein